MTNVMLFGWGAMLLLELGLLSFYIVQSIKIHQDPDLDAKSSALKLAFSLVLMLFGTIGFTPFYLSPWLRVICFSTIHFTLLLSFLANSWLISGRKETEKSKLLFYLVLILVVFVVILGFSRGDNTGFFLNNEPYQRNLIYYMYYIIDFFFIIVQNCFIVAVFYLSIKKSNNSGYIMRRTIGMTSWIVSIVCDIIVESNLLSSMLYGDFHRRELNDAFYLIIPMSGVFLMVNTFPQRYLDWFLQPVNQIINQREYRNRELQEYLREKMILVVSKAQRIPSLKHLSLESEIDDARDIIWSHIQHEKQISAKMEADFIFKLLQKNNVLEKSGKYPVPQGEFITVAYNIAVARHLKRLEAKSQLESNSAGVQYEDI